MKDQSQKLNPTMSESSSKHTGSQEFVDGLSPCNSQDGLQSAPCGQEAAPANLSPKEAMEKGLLTSATFGPPSTKSDPANDMSATPDEAKYRCPLCCWVPVAEGMPDEEDANRFGKVEWSDGEYIWEETWDAREGTATHWRRIVLP